MKRTPLTGIIIAALLLAGCAANKQEEYQAHYQNLMQETAEPESEQAYEISADAEDISDPDALRFFHDLYGLSSLEDQSLFWDGETLQISFYFASDAPSHQVDTARGYAIQRLLLGAASPNNPTPYEYWMSTEGKELDIAKVTCRIYVGEILMLQDNYADTQLAGIYENRKPVIAMRTFTPDNEAALQEIAGRSVKQPKLTFQKRIYDGAWVIHMETGTYLAPEKLEKLLADWSEAGVGPEGGYVVLLLEGEPYYWGFLSS